MPADEYFRTERLIARPFAPEDAEAFAAYRADEAVARFQGWSDFTLHQAQALIDEVRSVPLGEPGEWCQIALESRADGVLLGDLALHVQDDDPTTAEIGFTLAPQHQGAGFAREGLRGMLDHLFAELQLRRVIAITDARNARAAALLDRVGFRREAHHLENVLFKGEWASELVFAMLRSEWGSRGR